MGSLRSLFPALQSVVLGVLLPHPQPSAPPRLVWVGSADRVGWSHGGEQGGWLESLPTPGQPRVCLFQVLYSFLASEAEPRTTAGGWDLHHCPQGKE